MDRHMERTRPTPVWIETPSADTCVTRLSASRSIQTAPQNQPQDTTVYRHMRNSPLGFAICSDGTSRINPRINPETPPSADTCVTRLSASRSVQMAPQNRPPIHTSSPSYSTCPSRPLAQPEPLITPRIWFKSTEVQL